jgi:hypothetical protein
MAAVVSRRLGRDGYTVSSPARRHKREGLFVQGDRSGNVTVIADLDADSADTALELMSVIEMWSQTSNVSITTYSEGACFIRFTYTPRGK